MVTMAEPKDKFSISMAPELVARLDEVGAQRGEARSTVIERIIRNGIADEESFLRDMESPVYRTIMQAMVNTPKLVQAMAKLVGEHLSEEELEHLPADGTKQVELGKQRQKKKKTK